MSSKDLREKLDEIAQRRTRTPEGSPLSNFHQRMHAVLSAAMDVAGLRERGEGGWAGLGDELARHFPVAAVAAIEAYFRQIAGELIDHGEPFTARLDRLSQEKLPLSFAAAVQSQRCTVGEFLSHSLRIGGVNDINKTMSALLDVDFLQAVVKPTAPIPPASRRMVEKGTEDAVLALKTLFSKRHLLCHEFAIKPDIDLQTTILHLLEAVNFISFCHTVIADLRRAAIASAR